MYSTVGFCTSITSREPLLGRKFSIGFHQPNCLTGTNIDIHPAIDPDRRHLCIKSALLNICKKTLDLNSLKPSSRSQIHKRSNLAH